MDVREGKGPSKGRRMEGGRESGRNDVEVSGR